MNSARRLRVFLASPGDVGEERALARQVLAELPYDRFVGWRVVFEVVAWDQPRGAPLMLATKTPQASIAAGIARPSECDVVVVILWSRMGTPLPQQSPDFPMASYPKWRAEDATYRFYPGDKFRIVDNERLEPTDLRRALTSESDSSGSASGSASACC